MSSQSILLLSVVFLFTGLSLFVRGWFLISRSNKRKNGKRRRYLLQGFFPDFNGGRTPVLKDYFFLAVSDEEAVEIMHRRFNLGRHCQVFRQIHPESQE